MWKTVAYNIFMKNLPRNQSLWKKSKRENEKQTNGNMDLRLRRNLIELKCLRIGSGFLPTILAIPYDTRQVVNEVKGL
jgi:hypothetical protein